MSALSHRKVAVLLRKIGRDDRIRTCDPLTPSPQKLSPRLTFLWGFPRSPVPCHSRSCPLIAACPGSRAKLCQQARPTFRQAFPSTIVGVALRWRHVIPRVDSVNQTVTGAMERFSFDTPQRLGSREGLRRVERGSTSAGDTLSMMREIAVVRPASYTSRNADSPIASRESARYRSCTREKVIWPVRPGSGAGRPRPRSARPLAAHGRRPCRSSPGTAGTSPRLAGREGYDTTPAPLSPRPPPPQGTLMTRSAARSDRMMPSAHISPASRKKATVSSKVHPAFQFAGLQRE